MSSDPSANPTMKATTDTRVVPSIVALFLPKNGLKVNIEEAQATYGYELTGAGRSDRLPAANPPTNESNGVNRKMILVRSLLRVASLLILLTSFSSISRSAFTPSSLDFITGSNKLSSYNHLPVEGLVGPAEISMSSLAIRQGYADCYQKEEDQLGARSMAQLKLYCPISFS